MPDMRGKIEREKNTKIHEDKYFCFFAAPIYYLGEGFKAFLEFLWT